MEMLAHEGFLNRFAVVRAIEESGAVMQMRGSQTEEGET